MNERHGISRNAWTEILGGSGAFDRLHGQADDGEDEGGRGAPWEELFDADNTMLLDLGFFKLVDRVEGVSKFVGVFDPEVFAAGDFSDFLQGLGIKFLLRVCLDGVVEASLLGADCDGVDLDA